MITCELPVLSRAAQSLPVNQGRSRPWLMVASLVSFKGYGDVTAGRRPHTCKVLGFNGSLGLNSGFGLNVKVCSLEPTFYDLLR